MPMFPESREGGAGIDATLARVAAGQRGLVTRAQALDAGIGRGAIDDRVRRGALHVVHRGVYLVGHAVPPRLALEHAAILAAGPRVLIARASAAWMWGLGPPRPADVAVLAVGRQPRPRPGIAVHRTARLHASDVRRVEGVPVTTAARTIVDLAAVVDEPELERLVHEAQVLRLATPVAVRGALDRAGRVAGAAALRRLLAEPDRGATRLEAERALHRIIASAGLPRPHRNARVGPFEVDAIWRDAGLIVEVDGFGAHGTRRAFERDRRRDAELQASGYRVVRLTWRRMQREPVAIAAQLATLLARGPVNPAP